MVRRVGAFERRGGRGRESAGSDEGRVAVQGLYRAGSFGVVERSMFVLFVKKLEY
jgi:hypothetical protein